MTMINVVWRATAILLVSLAVGALVLTAKAPTASGQDTEDIATQESFQVLLNGLRIVFLGKGDGWQVVAYTNDPFLRDRVEAVAPSVVALANWSAYRYGPGPQGQPVYRPDGSIVSADAGKVFLILRRTEVKDQEGRALHVATVAWGTKASDVLASHLRTDVVLAREIRNLRSRVARVEAGQDILFRGYNADRAARGLPELIQPTLKPEGRGIKVILPSPSPAPAPTPEGTPTPAPKPTPSKTPPPVAPKPPKATSPAVKPGPLPTPEGTPTPKATTPAPKPVAVKTPAAPKSPKVVLPSTPEAQEGLTIGIPHPGEQLSRGAHVVKGTANNSMVKWVRIELGTEVLHDAPVHSDRSWSYNASFKRDDAPRNIELRVTGLDASKAPIPGANAAIWVHVTK